MKVCQSSVLSPKVPHILSIIMAFCLIVDGSE